LRNNRNYQSHITPHRDCHSSRGCDGALCRLVWLWHYVYAS